jgi:lipopolysaccharide/colanic/teichoic acid biosynthesis glycosyltransferase
VTRKSRTAEESTGRKAGGIEGHRQASLSNEGAAENFFGSPEVRLFLKSRVFLPPENFFVGTYSFRPRFSWMPCVHFRKEHTSMVDSTATRPRHPRLNAPVEEVPQAADSAAPGSYFRRKVVIDRLLAGGLLIPAVPLIGLLILLIRLTSRGPGLFRQVRLGKDGREYVMLKLRTMNIDAEARTGPVWSAGNDPRVTPLGWLLRKWHLDELPQLWNVLRGEMSLVGPRPERPEIVEVLAEAVPEYRNRLQVLPGVTGLAQINLRPDTDLYSVRRKLMLDMQYIGEAGVRLDLRILLCTALRLVGCSGDVAMRLTRLHREVTLSEGIDGHGVDLGLLCPQGVPDGQSDAVAGDVTGKERVHLEDPAPVKRSADAGREPEPGRGDGPTAPVSLEQAPRRGAPRKPR